LHAITNVISVALPYAVCSGMHTTRQKILGTVFYSNGFIRIPRYIVAKATFV